MLSPHAKQACISGRDKILQDIPKYTLQWMDPSECSNGCEQVGICSRNLACAVVMLWKSGISASDAFLQQEQTYWDVGLNHSDVILKELCSICQERSSTTHSLG